MLRVEDLDPPRVLPGAEAAMLEDLRWLGLDWDEGPDVGGAHGPYRQSERAQRYEEALAYLAERDLVYPCWCSRKDLRRARDASSVGESSAPHGPADDGPRYPGTCAHLDEAARDARRSETGRAPALRFRSPGGPIAIEDRVRGTFVQDVAREVGDFVVRRADGLFAYQLAVVVDDALMEVTEVVRGDDLLASAPRQVALFRALGFDPPSFGHVPLVTGAEGERLAKRRGARPIREMRASGTSATKIVGAIAASLGWAEAHEEIGAHEVVSRFDWSSVARARGEVAL